MTLNLSCAVWRNFQLQLRLGRLRSVLPTLSLQRRQITGGNLPAADHSFYSASLEIVNSFLETMKGLNLDGLREQLPKVNKESFTIAVEGNIGSGKSTLLRHFESLPNIEILGEPLDKWTNIEGHNALGLLYEDPERWSFSFNMYAMLTRMELHSQPHTRPVKLLERSVYSTRYCFVENNVTEKTLNGLEHSVLDQWFDYLTKDNKAELDLIVYLRADPEICLQRLKARSRAEEAGVPLSFIQSLHNYHDNWLINKKYPVPAPVLVLDANYDLDKMKETYDLRSGEILCGYR